MQSLWILILILVVTTMAHAAPRSVTDQDIVLVGVTIERGTGGRTVRIHAVVGTDDGKLRHVEFNPIPTSSAAERAAYRAVYDIAVAKAKARLEIDERPRPTPTVTPTATVTPLPSETSTPIP